MDNIKNWYKSFRKHIEHDKGFYIPTQLQLGLNESGVFFGTKAKHRY